MRTVVAFAALSVLAGCAEPARELARGPAGPQGPRVLLDSLALRFGPIQREAPFEAMRPKLVRAALTPSWAYDDPSIWVAREGEWRTIDLAGAASREGYRLGVRPEAPHPSRPGDYRERISLRRTGRGRFEWDLREELAAGEVRPQDLAAAMTALLRELQARDAAAVRAAASSTLPRTSRALAPLVRVETLRTAREASGSTHVDLALRLTPEGIRGFAPHYAEYLRKYLTPMQAKGAVEDFAGNVWWRLEAAANLWTLRLRVRDGRLVPLEGFASGPIPTELRVVVDYYTRMGAFGVGVRKLVVRVTLTRTPVEQGLVARFVEPPEWRVPFLVAPIIRGSLHHPFEGPGSEIAWAVRAQPAGPTLLVGRYRARVRESWLVRWLGGLTSHAVDDFRRGAEAEADRYNRDCLLALRDDLTALVR